MTTSRQELFESVSIPRAFFILTIPTALGKGETQRAGQVSALCFYGALSGGVLTCAILLLFQGPILWLLGADADILPYAAAYYRYIAL